MSEVPLFPLHAVLFPGGRLPLRLFEQRYLEMAKACMRAASPFGVCLIREGREVGVPAIPFEVGCLARIAHWDMPQLGVLNVTALGERRFRILERRVQADGLGRATIELLADETDGEIPHNARQCVRLLERVIAQQPALFEPPHRLDSAAWVGARLAELLPLPLPAKQQLLELSDASARLAQLSALLSAREPE